MVRLAGVRAQPVRVREIVGIEARVMPVNFVLSSWRSAKGSGLCSRAPGSTVIRSLLSCFGRVLWLWLVLVALEIAVAALLPEMDELWVWIPWKKPPEFFGVLATSAQLTDFGPEDGVASDGWLLRRMGA